MSITYLVGEHKYGFSHEELKSDYWRFTEMTDDEFMQPKTLLEAIHFCCVVAYVYEYGREATISDEGIIHELVHLALGANQRSLQEIRTYFKGVMRMYPDPNPTI